MKRIKFAKEGKTYDKVHNIYSFPETWGRDITSPRSSIDYLGKSGNSMHSRETRTRAVRNCYGNEKPDTSNAHGQRTNQLGRAITGITFQSQLAEPETHPAPGQASSRTHRRMFVTASYSAAGVHGASSDMLLPALAVLHGDRSATMPDSVMVPGTVVAVRREQEPAMGREHARGYCCMGLAVRCTLQCGSQRRYTQALVLLSGTA